MRNTLVRNKRLARSGISIPVIILAVFLIPTKLYAGPPVDKSTHLTNISAALTPGKEANSKKDLLQVYCSAMQEENVKNGFLDGSMYYSPSASLFVTTVCDAIRDDEMFYNTKLLQEDKKRSDIVGSIADIDEEGQPGVCNPSTRLAGCDLSQLLPRIFQAVMNEHSTLSVAGWALQGTRESQIKQFSTTYFGKVDADCKDSSYIGNKSATSEKDAYCSHPVTYQALRNTIDSLEKQKQNLRLLDSRSFSTIKDADLKKCTKPSEMYTTLYECAYTNASQTDAGPFQYNVRYNELLYYKLLITRLADDMYKNPNIEDTTLQENIVKNLDREKQNLKRELVISQNALQIMDRSITSIRSTLPLHIGLQAYYEDVVAFRKSLSKVYTPVHQLYYKLRNIQTK